MTTTETSPVESGLSHEEVQQRIRAGLVNEVPERPSRTTREIVRSNVVTRFNILLGALLLVVLLVLQEPRDALFGIVLITNSAIGIIQELRAKKTLDRLELVAAPRVRLLRSGHVSEHEVSSIVMDDVIDLRPGDQLAVDGEVLNSGGLEIDESLLTGESDPVVKEVGDECLSGSFVAAGSGTYRATRIGSESYAAKLAVAAKRFTLVKSELRDGIDWILGMVSWLVVPMGALLVWNATRGGREFLDGLRDAVSAGVAMIPQGLVLLSSIAFAVGVIRLGRKNVLVQELPAIEGLARVDVVCFDKTGTLTEGRLTVKEVLTFSELDPGPGLGALAAAERHPNATLAAIAAAYPSDPGWRVRDATPFSSARKWSAVSFDGNGTWVLGAPDILTPNNRQVQDLARDASERGSRVLLAALSRSGLIRGQLPPDLEPVALISLADQVRVDAADTIRYFSDQGIEVKVISGDHPDTVAAVARQVGIAGASNVVDARRLPNDAPQFVSITEQATVFGRVTPVQKRMMLKALQSQGHVVAMTGDGVNDVLALKDSNIGVAMGDGAPASRAVAQLVLIDSRFDRLPGILGEGRRVTANVERVANLFITSTVYALGLSLAIVLSTLPFPFLARHLTLVGSVTVGIPAFFLALAPSRRRARPGFVSRVLKFAIPTGLAATLATFAGYWLADLEGSTIEQSRTTATLILAAIGFFALAIVSRPLVAWKRALLIAMVGIFLICVTNPFLQDFFALEMPRAVVLLSAVGIVAITGTLMIVTLRALGWAKAIPQVLRDAPPPSPGNWDRTRAWVIDKSGWQRSFPATEEMEVLAPNEPAVPDPPDRSTLDEMGEQP